jgi:hypothetical protein
MHFFTITAGVLALFCSYTACWRIEVDGVLSGKDPGPIIYDGRALNGEKYCVETTYRFVIQGKESFVPLKSKSISFDGGNAAKGNGIHCCLWKHKDGICDNDEDDVLLGCETFKKEEKDDHIGSFEVRCADRRGEPEHEWSRSKTRPGRYRPYGTCSRDCSWFFWGSCERACGKLFFSHMKHCGYGAKSCCCYA